AKAQLVELAAEETQQRWIHLGARAANLLGLRVLPRYRAHDGLRHLRRDQMPRRTGAFDDIQRLTVIESREPHVVQDDGRNVAPQRVQVRQIVLAQTEQYAITRMRKREAIHERRILAHGTVERARRTILNEITEQFHRARREAPVVTPRRGGREQLLELIEHEHRNEKAARFVGQVELDVVQILPGPARRERIRRTGELLRLNGGRDGLRDLAPRRIGVGAQPGLIVSVVETNGDGKKPFLAETGKQTSLQQRRLAESGLRVEHGERLAPHAAEEIIQLESATEKEAPVGFAKRQQSGPRTVVVHHGPLLQRGAVATGDHAPPSRSIATHSAI